MAGRINACTARRTRRILDFQAEDSPRIRRRIHLNNLALGVPLHQSNCKPAVLGNYDLVKDSFDHVFCSHVFGFGFVSENDAVSKHIQAD